jgi:hypothetical protein
LEFLGSLKRSEKSSVPFILACSPDFFAAPSKPSVAEPSPGLPRSEFWCVGLSISLIFC